jgi:protein-tyrosine-phosphatase
MAETHLSYIVLDCYLARAGCNDQGVCPGPFFKPAIDWELEDPKGKPIEKVRKIRDEIEHLVQALVAREL